MNCYWKAFAITLMAFSIVLAQTNGPIQSPNKQLPSDAGLTVSIDKVHVVGRGLAVNPVEATDFKMLKIIIATVVIKEIDEEFGIGILFIDEKKYKLTNIEKTETTATADVYEAKTKVGTLSLTKVKKLDVEIWAGTVTVNDETLFVYIMGVSRQFKPQETGDKVDSYCQQNPEKCAGANKEECNRNPMAEPCQKVMREYCMTNQDDTRCRGQIGDYCQQNPSAPECSNAIPVIKCLKCIRPYAEQCGLTNEKCNWDAVTETTPPTCKPTPDEEKCMMQKAMVCQAECSSSMTQSTTAPIREPEYITPAGGQVCRKEVREICETMAAQEPVGSMSCEEAQAQNCKYQCITKDSKIDENCMFKCKSEGVRRCGTSGSVAPFAQQFNRPCMPPYMCGNKADMQQKGCTEIPELSCGATGVACMKCPTTGGTGGGYMCPSYWMPECGVDGKTYANACQAKASGIQIKFPGECGAQPSGTQPQGPAYCGNYVCEPSAGETVASCPSDCYTMPPNYTTPPLKPIGSPCVYGHECQTGYCGPSGYCYQSTTQPTPSSCSDGTPTGMCSMATANHRCTAYSGYNTLTYDSSCATAGTNGSNVCSDGTYVGSCSGPTPGYRCNPFTGYNNLVYDANCISGSTLRPLGASCQYPAECMSQQCPAGTCSQGTKTPGMGCVYTEECAVAYYCSAGMCTSSGGNLKADGASCTSPSECQGGYCNNYICASLPPPLKQIGELCSYPAECQSTYCVSGYCSASAPTPKSNGGPCTSPGECLSAICYSDSLCGSPVGGSCTTPSQCRSYNCNSTTYTCTSA